jgi:hypothetical protein
VTVIFYCLLFYFCLFFLFNFRSHNGVAPGTIAMNGVQRRVVYMGIDEVAPVAPFREPPERSFVAKITILVDYAFKGKSDDVEYTSEMFTPVIHKAFDNQFLSTNQKIVAKSESKIDFEFTIKSVEVVDVDSLKGKAKNTAADAKNVHGMK